MVTNVNGNCDCAATSLHDFSLDCVYVGLCRVGIWREWSDVGIASCFGRNHNFSPGLAILLLKPWLRIVRGYRYSRLWPSLWQSASQFLEMLRCREQPSFPRPWCSRLFILHLMLFPPGACIRCVIALHYKPEAIPDQEGIVVKIPPEMISDRFFLPKHVVAGCTGPMNKTTNLG